MPTHPSARRLPLLLAAVACACGAPPEPAPEHRDPASVSPEHRDPASVSPELAARAESDIRALLDRQTEAWNAGDLTAFVSDYLDSPRTRFASGGSVRYGTDEVLERYERNYPDAAARGRLIFGELEVRVLSPRFALVFGRYTLEREADTPTGLFTLLFEATPAGWKIAHDHTSTG